MSAVMWQSCDH